MPKRKDQDGLYKRRDSPFWWASYTDATGTLAQYQRSTIVDRSSRSRAKNRRLLARLHSTRAPYQDAAGELLGLEWARVDFSANLIHLAGINTKSDKRRSIPLNETARAALIHRAGFRASHCPNTPWVFCNRKGERIASIKKGFASAVKRAGIAHCTPHDLRRTCGSWLIQARIPIQEVARLLRHADIQTTLEVYGHMASDQLRETVATLDRHNSVIGQNSDERKTALSR